MNLFEYVEVLAIGIAIGLLLPEVKDQFEKYVRALVYEMRGR